MAQTMTSPRPFWMPQFGRVHIRAILVMSFAAFIFVFGKQFLIAHYLDLSEYYTYQGTAGPFAAIVDPTGKLTPGQAISRIRVGETMMWTTTSCFSAPINGYFVSELVRDSDHAIVQSNPQTFVGTKCGPSNGSVVIPKDIDPGQYSLNREMVLRPPKSLPISSQLPAIHIEVVR